MISVTDSELEAALRGALVHAEAGDWRALQRQVRRRRTRGTIRLALIAGVLSGLGVAQAFGVTPGVGSIFGTSAPAPVKSTFALVLLHHGVDPTTIRLAAQSHTEDGRLLRLWTGRTRSGDTCIQVQVGTQRPSAVGCGHFLPNQMGPDLFSIPNAHASMMMGGTGPRGTVRVRLVFADGTSRVIPAPKRSWVVGIPPRERRYGHDLRRIQALDASGKPLATSRLQFSQPPVRPATPWTTIARFDGQPLRVAKATTGGVCINLRRSDRIGVNTCPGTPRFGPPEPANVLAAWAIRFATPGQPGRLQLFGALPTGATSTRITLKSGRTFSALVAHHAFTIELPQTPASQPARLTFIAADGHVLDSISLLGPAAGGLYTPAWHDARYTIVRFGHINSLNYTVGPLQWPNGKITPDGPALAMWR